jgi:hypothetical protein
MKASLQPFRHLIEWRLKSSRVEYPVVFVIAVISFCGEGEERP